MKVYDKVTGWMFDQQVKHNLPDTFVDDRLERMSRLDFLLRISDAVDAVIAEALEVAMEGKQ